MKVDLVANMCHDLGGLWEAFVSHIVILLQHGTRRLSNSTYQRNVVQILRLVSSQGVRSGEVYKVQIILNHIVLERLPGQAAIAHTPHELMVCELMPRRLDIGAGEDVVDKIPGGEGENL